MYRKDVHELRTGPLLMEFVEEFAEDSKMLSATISVIYKMGYLTDFKSTMWYYNVVREVIEAMKRWPDDSLLQEKCMAAVGTLCSNCRENKDDFCDLDGPSVVIDMLDMHPENIRVQQTCFASLQFYTEAIDSMYSAQSYK